MDKSAQKAIFPHRLAAGLGLVLLAIVWAFGWITAPPNLFIHEEHAAIMRLMTTLILGAWNLLSCVLAAGFFHAASINQAKTLMGYRLVSLWLIILGIIILFPVPLMTQVLGKEPVGRALALVITGMSFAAIAFGRARINVIYGRLKEIGESEEHAGLVPFL
ncbi:MAG: hypothetical protein NTY09_06125 [bacterium]|nr:hypothetical protein [bacterium]